MARIVDGKIMLGSEAMPLVDAIVAVEARTAARKRAPPASLPRTS